jgi:hypothetical protein
LPAFLTSIVAPTWAAMSEQPAMGSDAHVAQRPTGPRKHVQPFPDGEHRGPLLRIRGHDHNDPIELLGSGVDQSHVAEMHGIERSPVETDLHGQRVSKSLSNS